MASLRFFLVGCCCCCLLITSASRRVDVNDESVNELKELLKRDRSFVVRCFKGRNVPVHRREQCRNIKEVVSSIVESNEPRTSQIDVARKRRDASPATVQQDATGPCQRVTFKVNFNDWDNSKVYLTRTSYSFYTGVGTRTGGDDKKFVMHAESIIYPPQVNIWACVPLANQCVGTSPSPAVTNNTNYDRIMHMERTFNPKRRMPASGGCVPTGYGSMGILFHDSSSNIGYTRLANAFVTRCGCAPNV